jgi:hypothetical protein
MNGFARWNKTKGATCEYRKVDKLLHPDAAIALRFWRGRPADGLRIGRDVPSRAIARLLSRIGICEPAGGDFRFHLAGSTIGQYYGREVGGALLSELYCDGVECTARRETLTGVIASGEPAMVNQVRRIGEVEVMHLEALVLPVTAADGIGRWVMLFAFFF